MKYTFNCLLLIVALLFSSCNKMVEVYNPGEPVPFSFSVEIAKTASDHSSPSTKAIVSATAFSNGAQIALFLTKDPSVSDKTYYFKKAVYELALSGSTQTWSAARGTGSLSLYNQAANLYALYPDNASFSIPTDDAPDATPMLNLTHVADGDMGDLSLYTLSTSSVPVGNNMIKVYPSEIDYLAGRGATTLTAVSPSTTITMDHSMAMLAINLQRDPSYLSPGLLTEFSVRNSTGGSQPLKKGAVDLSTMTFVPGADDASYRRSFINYHPNDNVGLLIYPATCGIGDITISLTIDGEVYEIKNVEEIKFQPGALTLINLNVMASKLFIDKTIMVNDWPDIAQEHEFELE